jgi:hypothetical protein
MIKRILGVVALLLILVVGGLLFFGLMLPADWFVIRDQVIAATPEQVYPLFADFKNWDKWSPWQLKDKEMKVTIPGKSTGVGAKQTWESPTQGSGETEIIENARNHFVTTRIAIHAKRFETEFHARIELHQRQDGNTEIRWVAFGSEPKLLPKLMAQLTYDRYMGEDFELGLAKIKKMAETKTAD